jgi:hypothetical protein
VSEESRDLMADKSEQLYILDAYITNSMSDTNPHRHISLDSIVDFEIKESILNILPKVNMTVSDTDNLINADVIIDKTVLHIKLNTPEDKPELEINAMFIISAYSVESTNNNNGTMVRISGYMANDGMLTKVKYDYIKGNSSDVVKQLVIESGLKYDGVISSNESIIWYQRTNNYTFLKNVADRAYIPDDGVFVYGTFDGVIHYTTYNTQITNNSVGDAVYKNDILNYVMGKDDVGKIYYNGFDIVNVTNIYNNLYNYGGHIHYYDLEEFIQKPLVSLKRSTQLLDINTKYYDLPVFSKYIGAVHNENVISLLRGKVLNIYTKYQLFSNTVSIRVNISTDIKLFDKINLNIQSITNDTDGSLVEPYSGEYLVTNISHSVGYGKNYEKRILLSRRGINKNVDYDKYQECV